MAGIDLPDNQVIRASRDKHYLHKEEYNFCRHSNVNRPTYGNCLLCWKSGPLSKVCDECPGRHCAYHQLFYVTTCGRDVYLDAESISKVMRKGHEVAKADQKIDEIKYDRFEINVELFLAKCNPDGCKEMDELSDIVLQFFGGDGYGHCSNVQTCWYHRKT